MPDWWADNWPYIMTGITALMPLICISIFISYLELRGKRS